MFWRRSTQVDGCSRRRGHSPHPGIRSAHAAERSPRLGPGGEFSPCGFVVELDVSLEGRCRDDPRGKPRNRRFGGVHILRNVDRPAIDQDANRFRHSLGVDRRETLPEPTRHLVDGFLARLEGINYVIVTAWEDGSVPNGVFNPYTGIKTNPLFFTKGQKGATGSTRDIWFYEHPYPPDYKSYSKTKPIRIEEFELEKKWWGRPDARGGFKSRKSGEQAWKVSAPTSRRAATICGSTAAPATPTSCCPSWSGFAARASRRSPPETGPRRRAGVRTNELNGHRWARGLLALLFICP